jgi:hypothetical protein
VVVAVVVVMAVDKVMAEMVEVVVMAVEDIKIVEG